MIMNMKGGSEVEQSAEQGQENPTPNTGSLEIGYLREVATRPAAGLRIIEGAEWKVFYDDYEKGLLFIGHKSQSGGIDYLTGSIREAEVAEFIATFNPRTVNALLDMVENVIGRKADEVSGRIKKAEAEVERLRAYAEALPPQRSVLHLYRAEEDGLIHFESESGNHVVLRAERWAELGEPDAITIGVWVGVL